MSLPTPSKIRELQNKLYRKAKNEPRYRFYLLYDKIWREDILAHAYEVARANQGAPGGDGESFGQIETGGRQQWLNGLREELRHKRYRPQQVRRVMIPKAGGGERPLGIPTIRDRVVQTAAKIVLEPIFEADLEPNAYGYRPKQQARKESFDFLGYTFGPHRYRKDGHWYLGASPSKKAVARIKGKVKDLLVRGRTEPWVEVRERLNQILRGWSAYFSYGTRTTAYRAVDNYVYHGVRQFLRRRHKVPSRGTRRFSDEVVFGELRVLRLRRVQLGPRS
jgi:hypothetical protein